MAEKKAVPAKKAAVKTATPKVSEAPEARKVSIKKKVEPTRAFEKEKAIQVHVKMANPDPILKCYDKLISELAKTESAQRNQAKPYRIYLAHRKRAEAMRMNFVKSMR